MSEDIHFPGSKFQFAVPDAFQHEGEIRNFMLIVDNNNSIISAVYADNECDCKDGWVKFQNIPFDDSKGRGLFTQDIIAFLDKYYFGYVDSAKEMGVETPYSFDKQTFKWL